MQTCACRQHRQQKATTIVKRIAHAMGWKPSSSHHSSRSQEHALAAWGPRYLLYALWKRRWSHEEALPYYHLFFVGTLTWTFHLIPTMISIKANSFLCFMRADVYWSHYQYRLIDPQTLKRSSGSWIPCLSSYPVMTILGTQGYWQTVRYHTTYHRRSPASDCMAVGSDSGIPLKHFIPPARYHTRGAQADPSHCSQISCINHLTRFVLLYW